MRPIPARAEYDEQAAQFRAYLKTQSARPRDAQEWPEDTDEWMGYPATVICRTPRCPAAGTPYQLKLHEHADGRYRSTCYPCGQAHQERWIAFADEPVNVGTPAPTEPAPAEPSEKAAPDEGGLRVHGSARH